ncbi:AEC family transporter [Amphritea sp. 1_MG-2023]|uniref:AEC family transporter n=1 Tax=Amphritea sp. 1_MG-2023 TaxID=3062670 RepID=UPI0026E2735A|nr:AEC family transporter [Amphritea sp. 1_MG-2023]MDO6565179.1 AEC family transporter [Amphritea sp. 1_MG-2023]
MSEILTALWPVFALLCIGHIIRRIGFPGDGFWEPAEKLIYFLLFPLLLIYKLSLADIGAVPVADVALAVTVLLVSGTLLLLGIQRFKPLENRRFTSVYQGGMRFNTYVGLAACAALYGDEGVAIAAVIIAVMIPLLNFLCVLIFSVYTRKEAGYLSALTAIGKNPLIIACCIGIFLNLSGIGLPWAVASAAELVSGMALPLALLAVGAGLNLTVLRKAGGAVIYSSGVKLMIFPVLMLLICIWLIDSPAVAQVLLLFSALPTAPSAYVLARQLDGDATLMAAIITGQTLLSMLLMPVSLSIFQYF